MAVDDNAAIKVDKMAAVGSKCEIRIWQQRYKRDGRQEFVAQDGLEQGELKEDEDYALVAKKEFNDKNVLERTSVQINSPHLLRVFREVVKSYVTVPADFEEPFEMESPFRMLYHYWDDLDSYRSSVDDDTVRMHLNLLFDFMKSELGPDKARCDSMIKRKQMTYSLLWTIYRPGDLQYTSENGHSWLLRMVKTAYEENTKVGKWFEVHCSYSDYDGSHVGQAMHIFKIYQKRSFAAENPAIITDLAVFPRKFLQGCTDLEEKLCDRGVRFLELRGVCVKKYDGLAQYLKDPPMDFWDPDMAEFEGVWIPYLEAGRVVLDRKTFQEDNHLEQVSVHRALSEEEENPVDYPDKMLYPPYAYGYSLARKDWCKFYVDDIHEVQWSQNLFDSLVMGERQKRLLRALVTSHTFPNNARDQMQQKGKGLVILLHGTPGSGKTLTAESVAELTGKALLSTTMGELNKENRAWFFEYMLKQVLEYATIWKAVVVLDEADVFLEARQDTPTGGVERNALVAVFLRHLEYFSGIVFLTSNRVTVFDTAMKSRIHLAIEYSPPELQMRKMIWRQCLREIPASESAIDLDEAIPLLIRDRINGREISNAVTTARTLARFEKIPLQLQHLDTVMQVRRDFDVSIAQKRRALEAAERHGSSPALNRANSLLVSSEEPSDWLPEI